MENSGHLDLLRKLHFQRSEVVLRRTLKQGLLDNLANERPELFQGLKDLEGKTAETESQLRTEVLSLYKTIPNMGKTDLLGVTIKEGKVVEYDPDAALAWAKEHGLAVRPVSLNEAEFKKLVLSGVAGIPATVKTELTVAIDRDLAPFVGPGKEEAQDERP